MLQHKFYWPTIAGYEKWQGTLRDIAVSNAFTVLFFWQQCTFLHFFYRLNWLLAIIFLFGLSYILLHNMEFQCFYSVVGYFCKFIYHIFKISVITTMH